MKCHYEVLEAARDADPDTLKKQYRKMALKVVDSLTNQHNPRSIYNLSSILIRTRMILKARNRLSK